MICSQVERTVRSFQESRSDNYCFYAAKAGSHHVGLSNVRNKSTITLSVCVDSVREETSGRLCSPGKGKPEGLLFGEPFSLPAHDSRLTGGELPLRLKAVNTAYETPDVRTFELVDVAGKELPPFSAGAHVDVTVTLPNGNREQRSYSLTGDPEDHSRYLIAVLREKNGSGGSAFMHENVSIGDLLEVSRPKNDFPLAKNATGHLLIAGGIGITPLLSMARVLAASASRFYMHYCTRAPEVMAFRREIESICGTCASLYFDGGDPAKGIDLGSLLGDPRPGWHVYVCGPRSMIDDVRRVCREGGWPDDNVHFESFAQRPKETGDQTIEVVLARSEMTIMVPPDRSILDVLIEAGINPDYDCKRGECGVCVTTVLEGEPLHRDYCLSESERRSNRVMQICVSRARSGRLVLDL